MDKGLILGIDPGLDGGWAILDGASGAIVDADDLPTSGVGSGRCIEGSLLASLLDEYPEICAAGVELVNAMPKQGVASSFRFGQATGEVLGVLKARRIRLHRPTPQSWKKHHGLRGSDKELSRQKAIHLWPASASLFKLKKHSDRAEAALIAAFIRETKVAVA